MQMALAPLAQAGVTSTVTGADFGDAFRGSSTRSVVALGLADVQTGIGDVFANGANGGEGSLGHVMLHGLAGCVAGLCCTNRLMTEVPLSSDRPIRRFQ
jgi:hypothetical protein